MRKTILLLYYIPEHNVEKFNHWHDGFVAAMQIVSAEHDIIWFNLAEKKLTADDVKSCDFVFVKSNWGWIPDLEARCVLANTLKPKALLISGVTPPPDRSQMLFYDLLFYEVQWYRSQIEQHPRILHAFGVDTDTMNSGDGKDKKVYDWITVGNFSRHKRLERLIAKKGKIIAVGEIPRSAYSTWIRFLLRLFRIKIVGFIPYKKLADYYRISKAAYIPAAIVGGGERAVLEARACGIPVFVEKDNPKLKELADGPLWDHRYYATQLKKGIALLAKDFDVSGNGQA